MKLILIKYCLFNAMYPKYYHFSKLSLYKLTILYLCVCVLSLGNLVDIFHLKHTSIQTSHIYFLFLFLFFNFNFFKHLFWSISALHWCVSFCFIGKWVNYTYTYIPISLPSCIFLPSSLSHPSRWSQSTKLISLCYVAASH